MAAEVCLAPAAVARAFSAAAVELRAKALSRLLSSVGPLALLVVAGGAFVKFVRQARRPGPLVSVEDAARATSNQVFELARYVQQANPKVARQVLALLAQPESPSRVGPVIEPRRARAAARAVG